MSETTSPIRVLSVDDHPLIREGISGLISGNPRMQLVGEASNGLEAVAKYRELKPDVTLMDIQMPILNGLDAMKTIRAEYPGARIIVLTTYSGDMLAQRGIKAGAQAYLLKQNVRLDLLDTIIAVHSGQKKISPEVATELAYLTENDYLSEREVRVLASIADGNCNKRVAKQLEIAEGTVKTHVKSIMAKLQANDRTHAVMVGLRRGIIGI